jgi:hypothetical protein
MSFNVPAFDPLKYLQPIQSNYSARSTLRIFQVQSRMPLLLGIDCRDWRTIYDLLVNDPTCAM